MRSGSFGVVASGLDRRASYRQRDFPEFRSGCNPVSRQGIVCDTPEIRDGFAVPGIQEDKVNGSTLQWQPEYRDRRRAANLPPGLDAGEKSGDPAVLTVLLADTQPAVRHWVRSALESADGITVVGETATANTTIAEVARRVPDVLVIDPQLGRTSPVDVISSVLRVAPETGILVLSAVDDDAVITAAIQAGVRGYLVRDTDQAQIVRGVRVVAAGEMIVGKSIARRFGSLVRQNSEQEPYPFPELTARERDVLDGIAAGRSNAVIAADLGLSPKTVSNRVSSIFGKLGVADRAQAIVLARDVGLGRG
jgi:DNA-binding NarL/FixJ family response regulator